MASPTSANFDDFQRIILAMIFPIQIVLEIKYSTIAAPGIDACFYLLKTSYILLYQEKYSNN